MLQTTWTRMNLLPRHLISDIIYLRDQIKSKNEHEI